MSRYLHFQIILLSCPLKALKVEISVKIAHMTWD